MSDYFINEKLEVKRSTEVLVAGGGVAGAAAAIAAARKGAKVVLIEKSCALGGLATLGLVTIFLPLCDGNGKQVIFGLTEELLRLSIKYGAEAEYPKEWLEGGEDEERINHRFQVRFNANLFAIALEELLLKEGVEIMYNTNLVGAFTENCTLKGVAVETREGRSVIEAKAFVDATGDAVLANLAGEQTKVYDKNRFASWYYYDGGNGNELEMCAEPLYGETTDRLYRGINDADETEFIIRGHKKILSRILDRRAASGVMVMPTAIPHMAELRMTRRLVGKTEVGEKNMFGEFADSIGKSGDWRNRGVVIDVPLSCLCGKTRNLFCAGRCVSCDEEAWDILRVIPDCTLTGEAAGKASALVAKGRNIEEIDIGEIRS